MSASAAAGATTLPRAPRSIAAVLREEGRRLAIPLLGAALLFGLSFPIQALHAGQVPLSLRASAAAIVALVLALAARLARTGGALAIEARVVRVHWVQACCHTSVFLYWGWYWPHVYPELPLIYAQMVFLYSLDAVLSWWRRGTWAVGLGPLPIVYSTNLFLWFRDDWYLWQFAMIAAGALGKELVRWTKDGREAHIFNPSAFSLSLASIALLATGRTSITWGHEVATTLELAPHMYFLIFGLGLVVQYSFGVTLVTVFAVAACVALNLLYTAATGVYFMTDTTVPIAVFLGAHLLVTDPATSPGTRTGRAIFGAAYGASVFALFGVLDAAGVPLFYDKLLNVPPLNLCVRALDRLVKGSRLARLEPAALGVTPERYNLVAMGAWVALFAALTLTHQFGPRHPGHSIEFWMQAAREGKPDAVRKLLGLLRQEESHGDAGASAALGMLYYDGRFVPRDRERAAAQFARASDLGSADAARMLVGRRLAAGEGRGQEDAVRRAWAKVARDAEAGDPASLYIAGLAHLSGELAPRDAARAAALLERASDAGWTDASLALADVCLAGRDLPRDPARAARALERACEGGSGQACDMLAGLVYRGDGAPRSEERARELMRRSCERGWEPACAWLRDH